MRSRFGLALFLAACFAESVASGEIDVDLARYRTGESGRGAVIGRAWAEPRRVDGAEQPLGETVVTLVPRSRVLLRSVEDIKARSRDSVDAYRSAANAIRGAREAFEKALRAAGAADLVLATTADATGRFGFPAVPPGDWVLFGWRATTLRTRVAHIRRRDKAQFRIPPPPESYSAVMIWLREVTVRDDEDVTLDLTDRNGWFSGVVESTAPSATPPGQAIERPAR